MITPRPFHRRSLAAFVAAGAVALAAAPTALAHDVVIGGNPADGAVVEEFPDSIELEFSGLPQEGFSTLAITDQDSGETLYSGEPTMDGQMVTLDLPEDVTAGPGEYTVGFQITSSDGHATRGTTTFTVAGEEGQPAGATSGAATTAEQAEATETTEEPTSEETFAEEETSGLGGPAAWILGGLGILVVIGVIVMLIAKNRTTNKK